MSDDTINNNSHPKPTEDIMTTNIVSLQAYRALKECQKLFLGYSGKLSSMPKVELLLELEKYRAESLRYPGHLLTIVKGEILMGFLRKCSLSGDLQEYAKREEYRLRSEVDRRLRGEYSN